MIEKHISELLKTNERVIIPNFGAFLKSKGEVKSIIFNEFIKFNDGQLIQFVSEKENISIEDASQKLDEFVEEIKAAFAKGSKIPIKDVGILYQDDKGRLRFDSEGNAETTKSEEPKVVADKAVEKKTEEKKAGKESRRKEGGETT